MLYVSERYTFFEGFASLRLTQGSFFARGYSNKFFEEHLVVFLDFVFFYFLVVLVDPLFISVESFLVIYCKIIFIRLLFGLTRSDFFQFLLMNPLVSYSLYALSVVVAHINVNFTIG